MPAVVVPSGDDAESPAGSDDDLDGRPIRDPAWSDHACAATTKVRAAIKKARHDLETSTRRNGSFSQRLPACARSGVLVTEVATGTDR